MARLVYQDTCDDDEERRKRECARVANDVVSGNGWAVGADLSPTNPFRHELMRRRRTFDIGDLESLAMGGS